MTFEDLKTNKDFETTDELETNECPETFDDLDTHEEVELTMYQCYAFKFLTILSDCHPYS